MRIRVMVMVRVGVRVRARVELACCLQVPPLVAAFSAGLYMAWSMHGH